MAAEATCYQFDNVEVQPAAFAVLKDGRALVEYTAQRSTAFKSVEKLRYDFERDAEDALRQA